jgi:16S rRNA (cytosine1402-N4)-methyltransferase
MTSPANEPYHVPVLAREVVTLLVTDPHGAYLDATIGGGGHAKAIAQALSPQGRLYGIDRDPVAVAKAREELRGFDQVRDIAHAPFSTIGEVTGAFADCRFAGILLDLGVSSRQIDAAERGFTFQGDGPLDMRMDPALGVSAADLVNECDEKQIAEIIFEFGEERQAARLARTIVRERQKEMIRTTARLSEVISQVVSGPHRVKTLARVFQAFRIAVNRELDELHSVLPAAFSILNPSGRLAVISYHSLEDRQVKRFFQEKTRPHDRFAGLPMPNADLPPEAVLVTRKPVVAGAEETGANPRARSAKLRVMEKV